MQMFMIISAGLFWYLSSIIVNISWKRAIHNNPHLINITIIQLAVAELISVSVYLSLGTSKKRLIKICNKEKCLILGMGTSFALGQLFTNASLSMLSVSLTHIIKLTEPIIALAFGIIILKDNVPPKVVVYTFFILSGVAIASINDISFIPQGVMFTVISNFGMQGRNLFLKLIRISNKLDLDNVTLFILSNLVALVLLCALMLFDAIIRGNPLVLSLNLDKYSTLCGVCFAVQHIMSFYVLQNVLISTHALLNVFKRLLIILISSVIMQKCLSLMQLFGLGFALIGFLLYKIAMEEKKNMDIANVEVNSPANSKAKFKGKHGIGICFLILGILIYSNICPMQTNSLSLKHYIIESGPQITVFWSYTRKLDDSSISLLNSLTKLYPYSNITLYCGSLKCWTSAKYLRSISLKQLKVLKLTSNTPLDVWAKQHPLMKIISGPSFPRHLQKAVHLAVMWNIGGIVFDLDLPVANETMFASRLSNMSTNTCVMYASNVTLGLCNLEKKHPFVKQLMKSFVSSFTVKSNQPWPYVKNFGTMVNLRHFQALSEMKVPQDVTKMYLDILGKSRTIPQSSQFGLIHYIKSKNIGDEIQSIAAAHFLPKIDVLLPRDKKIVVDKNTTVIMNAFWQERSWLFGSWPNIHPIQVSMHVAYYHSKQFRRHLEQMKKLFLTHGVVGTRDSSSAAFLNKIGIPAKMTGCLTLLYQNPHVSTTKRSSTYLVDVDANLLGLIPNSTLHSAIFTHHKIPRKTIYGIDRYIYAYTLLKKYAQAKLVITTRIHCALPCVAFGTPVIFLNLKTLNDASKNKESPRVSGLTSLFHTVDFYKQTLEQIREFLNNFDYVKPPSNPNQKLADGFRNSLWSFLKSVDDIRDIHNMYDLLP